MLNEKQITIQLEGTCIFKTFGLWSKSTQYGVSSNLELGTYLLIIVILRRN